MTLRSSRPTRMPCRSRRSSGLNSIGASIVTTTMSQRRSPLLKRSPGFESAYELPDAAVPIRGLFPDYGIRHRCRGRLPRQPSPSRLAAPRLNRYRIPWPNGLRISTEANIPRTSDQPIQDALPQANTLGGAPAGHPAAGTGGFGCGRLKAWPRLRQAQRELYPIAGLTVPRNPVTSGPNLPNDTPSSFVLSPPRNAARRFCTIPDQAGGPAWKRNEPVASHWWR